MGNEKWDVTRQKAETFYTVAQLILDKKLAEGSKIKLELFFIPAENAALEALMKAFKTFGYAAEPMEGTVMVTVGDVAFDAETIWLHEGRLTTMALARGFIPDGWGFLEP